MKPTMEKWFYIQDTCGVNNLHGMPAILSAIASAIAAGVASIETQGSKVGYGNRYFSSVCVFYINCENHGPYVCVCNYHVLKGINV